jgi:hypothetical protein
MLDGVTGDHAGARLAGAVEDFGFFGGEQPGGQ